MSDYVAIKVDGVSKSFRLPHEKTSSIKGSLTNLRKRRKGYENQHVLKNVSFEIKQGEFFGIVGRNGSGKSTLLKLLAGIYTPSQGSIEVNGKLTPFIELGVGFNPELTGRENVYLNGALLGFSRSEIDKMYHEIVEFAELEKFMDQKLKNYSSGMQVRLAFSIAIRANTDILLIDEVLAVGDVSFQQKCYQVFDELKEKKKTIILVTHDMSAVLRFCSKAMLINEGKIEKIGKPVDITDHYLELNYENEQKMAHENDGARKVKTNGAKIIDIEVMNANHKPSVSFSTGDTVACRIRYSNSSGELSHFGLQIYSDTGVYCFGTNSKIDGLDPSDAREGSVEIQFSAYLNAGNYYLSIASMDPSLNKVYDYKPKISSFRVLNSDAVQGVVPLKHKWEFKDV